jgi:hypothetical protein
MPTKKKRPARNLAKKGHKGNAKARIKKKTKKKNLIRALTKIKREYGKYTTLTPEGRTLFLKIVKGIASAKKGTS